MELVELVPNVSEGRSAEIVDEIASALTAEGSWLLDLHRDESLHRSVLTAAARPRAVVDRALRLFERSLRRIDLKGHRGAHPRLGAVDVFPLVPLRDSSRPSVVLLARRLGLEVAAAFDLPVFLYGDAALQEENRELPRLRRGGFEALADRLSSKDLVPDYGPPRPHPTAGATAVGVRDFLIAYNVELETTDPDVARAVARRVRASSGGLRSVRALGFALPHRGRVQVSMNLTDFRVTSMATAFDAVVSEAAKLGAGVARSEIVGLVPEAATFAGMVERLKLDRPPGILEERLKASGLEPPRPVT